MILLGGSERRHACTKTSYTSEVTRGPHDESVGIPEIRWTGKWKGGCLWIIPGLAYCSPVESIPGEETDGFMEPEASKI